MHKIQDTDTQNANTTQYLRLQLSVKPTRSKQLRY